MRIVIIGGAPTALGAAYRLNELKKTHPDITKDVELVVLEKENVAGGLSTTVIDDKGFLWDMGGHVTFSHNAPYYDAATKWAVKEWNSLERQCLVDMNYLYDIKGIKLVPYPAQYAVPFFPNDIKEDCIKDLNERHDNPKYDSIVPNNFAEWIDKHLGETIHKIFFKPYTKKVWTVETETMNPNWVGSRVAKLSKEKLESLCSIPSDQLTDADFGWGPNACFTFPKYGGTGAVWKGMAEKLNKEWFKYNHNVVAVNMKNKEVTYQVGQSTELQKIKYDYLINTAPIDQLVKQTNACSPLNIVYNKVYVVGVGLKLPMPPSCEKLTWLYFPDPNVPFFRVTFFSRYGEVTPDNTKYWSVMCECATPIDYECDKEEMANRAVEGLILKDIIKREQVETVFSILLPYGYPIPSVERDSELKRAHESLEKNQIYSRGRFGGWKYEVSNQDHVFMQGKEIIDRILLNEPEKMYKTGINYDRAEA
ncbi:Amine oxidase domain-containing protein [Strongyloides ratti]|uniref:Amine oxidase domain-containing protein n=1 Tax=Strongyloides ratti TaxID=34506 RepID=A0A090KWW5_STRRB|nr:Amine oxidase domain-containing protein [Strongyloides ratti]CEF59697.1 Amine oxidase domain-containing protein [Strongyloides ratti]